MHVTLFSLEPWDEVWRRNQHLTTELVGQGLVSKVSFVEPPLLRGRAATWSPSPGVEVVTPWMPVPKRLGGLALAAAQVMRAVGQVDVVWVNDPAFGVHAVGGRTPAVYDVTDDWRSFGFPARIIRRVVRAEDRLAGAARTIVCSTSLRERWAQRYGVDPVVVPNGVDLASWRSVTPKPLAGAGAHVGYIGTLQDDRLDVDLVLAVAERPEVGSVHLVGPDALGAEARDRLVRHPAVRLHGPVPSAEVASWTTAMDVLVSPHLLNDFTMSLDAIKAREYVASGRPVVATPTSGFQLLGCGRVTVAGPHEFAAAVAASLPAPRNVPSGQDVPEAWTWQARARAFHAELVLAAGRGQRSSNER